MHEYSPRCPAEKRQLDLCLRSCRHAHVQSQKLDAGSSVVVRFGGGG